MPLSHVPYFTFKHSILREEVKLEIRTIKYVLVLVLFYLSEGDCIGEGEVSSLPLIIILF